jgi:hypothetical protein
VIACFLLTSDRTGLAAFLRGHGIAQAGRMARRNIMGHFLYIIMKVGRNLCITEKLGRTQVLSHSARLPPYHSVHVLFILQRLTGLTCGTEQGN